MSIHKWTYVPFHVFLQTLLKFCILNMKKNPFFSKKLFIFQLNIIPSQF